MQESEDKTKKDNKAKVGRVRRVFRTILFVILGFFTLNALLYVTLSIPFVQNKLIGFVGDKLGEMLKTEVRVSEVRINLFNHLSLKDLYVADQSSDTLVYAHHIEAHLRPLAFLFKQELIINEVKLDDFFINITAADSISDYNFQFIVDEFSSSDTTAVDTSSSSLPIIIDDIKITNGRLAHRIKSNTDSTTLFNPSDIYVLDVNASLDIHSLDMKSLDIAVNSITAKEKSGLEISQLKGHVVSEGSRLILKDLLLSLPNSHLTAESLFYDLETQEFEFIAGDTKIAPSDLAPLMSNLKYLNQTLTLKTTIKGKLPGINAENILLTYGTDAILEGNAFITSYEDLGGTNFGANIRKLNFTPRGLESLVKLGDETFRKPEMLDSLGTILFNGTLSGKLNNFHLDSRLSTKNGALALVGGGSVDTTFTFFDVKAQLNTTSFDLAPIIGRDKGVGKLSMHVDIDAQQKGSGTLSAKLKGAIDSLGLMDGDVKALPFAASFGPNRIAFGADAKLNFGHFMAGLEMSRTDKPDIRFAMRIQDVDVAHFYKSKYWDKPSLGFDVKGTVNKFDIDNLNANVIIKDLKFVDSDFNYTPTPIELKAWRDSLSDVKNIALTSTILSANVKGDYKFSTLAEELSGLMHDYLSNVFPAPNKKLKYENDFTFNVKVHNSEELGYIFNLPIDLIEPLDLDGVINTKEQTIDLVGQLPLAKGDGMEIRDIRLTMANIDSAFSLKIDTDIATTKGGYDLGVNLKGADNTMYATIAIDSDTVGVKLKGKIDTKGEFSLDEHNKLVSLFEILPSDIHIGQFIMNILPATITNVAERTYVEDLGIGINNKKYLDINGYVSSNPEDSLFINFSKAQIADVLQGFNIENVYAEVDGNIIATKILEAPEFYTQDFKIKNITLYKDTLGTLDVDTQWNAELGGINLYSTLTQKQDEVILLEGLINPMKETLDLHMDVERFSIAWLKPYMEGLLTDISGDVSSHLTIKGTLDELITEGFLGFNDTKIGIEYTNVKYFIADTINITPSKIGFDNLILKDSEGNTGTVNATFTHNNFKDIKYNLNMRAQNLLVLNTQSRTDSLFYGKLFASGTVRIDGSDKGIDLNMQLRNGKKSNLNITLPQVSEASEYKSVVYINVPEEKLPKKEDPRWRRGEQKIKEQEIPITIKMKLDVDPELELAVVIDPETGDRMNTKGNGTINFNYDLKSQNMTVFGDYNVTDGGVRLNLQNISRLDFKIKEGSKLNFIGDPFKTKFDITAYRRVRADLRTMDISFEQDNTSPRVQVDCLLGITGDINKMDLSYDIELVGASDDQVRKVKSLVNTDEIKIKQFAYLIASGTFYSNTGSSGANFTDGMWTSLASTALSGGLNAVFGSILGENWELGADISDGDTSVSATTSLLNDKLKLHANVGYRAESSASSNESIIGDFDVEYILNSTWTLKAYSHTNDRFDRQAPTTQGVGIVYTREGSTFKGMFKSIGRRRGAWARLDQQARDSIRIRRRDSIAALEIKAHEGHNHSHKTSDDKERDPVVIIDKNEDTKTHKHGNENIDATKQPARNEEETYK